MVRSLIIVIVLLTGGILLSSFYIGYPHAGQSYISKHREKRKSIRSGSGGGLYHFGSGGQRGFRGGK